MPNLIRVEIYSRPGCRLCDEAKDVLERVRRRRAFDLTEINIETDPKLVAAFGTEIPVVFVNGSKAFKYSVDERELEKRLERLWNK